MALWGVAARQGDQVGLALIVQFAEPVGLDPVVQHTVQTLVGVSPLDPVHRAFGHVQSGSDRWHLPTLIDLQQDPGSGGDARRMFAAPDQSVQSFSLLRGQLYGVSLPRHGCCTSPQSEIAASIGPSPTEPQVLSILL